MNDHLVRSLLLSTAVLVCAHRSDGVQPAAEIQGRFEVPACDTVAIGSSAVILDGQQDFELTLPIDRPDYFTLECGEPVTLFLSPGDSLRMEVGQDDSIRFSGRGSQLNGFVAELARSREEQIPRLLASYPRLVTLEESLFVSSWDSAWNDLFEPLERFLESHLVPEKFARTERARLLYPWAERRVRYPFLRWRANGASLEVSEEYHAFLSQLELNDPDLLSLEEYRSFLGAFVHEKAREELRQDPALQKGDNRWTRAKYGVALRFFTDEQMRNHVLHTILAEHIDHYGSKALEELLDRFRRDCTDERLVASVTETYREDRRNWEGHEIEVYKQVDGLDLDAHIYRPEGSGPGEQRPALVWFHGGSWYEGAWYWSMGLCHPFVLQGMVVIQIEYRIQDRHGSTPLESIADAKSAVRWVRTHANRLGVDPSRIVVAGFSSGGHLAASTALLEGFEEAGESPSATTRPDAMVLIGACVDPTLDPWYAQVVRSRVAPEASSPAHQVRAGLPPALVIHGTADGMCAFPSAKSFADQMSAAGNRCEIEAFEGRPHFFLWQSREDRAEAVKRMQEFLTSLGFLPERN